MQIAWTNNHFMNNVIVGHYFDYAVHMGKDVFDYFLTGCNLISCFDIFQ